MLEGCLSDLSIGEGPPLVLFPGLGMTNGNSTGFQRRDELRLLTPFVRWRARRGWAPRPFPVNHKEETHVEHTRYPDLRRWGQPYDLLVSRARGTERYTCRRQLRRWRGRGDGFGRRPLPAAGLGASGDPPLLQGKLWRGQAQCGRPVDLSGFAGTVHRVGGEASRALGAGFARAAGDSPRRRRTRRSVAGDLGAAECGTYRSAG